MERASTFTCPRPTAIGRVSGTRLPLHQPNRSHSVSFFSRLWNAIRIIIAVIILVIILVVAWYAIMASWGVGFVGYPGMSGTLVSAMTGLIAFAGSSPWLYAFCAYLALYAASPQVANAATNAVGDAVDSAVDGLLDLLPDAPGGLSWTTFLLLAAGGYLVLTRSGGNKEAT